MRVLLLAALLALAGPAQAQQAGWHFSPFPGEGDRAALGCARGGDATHFTCLAVRCEDDFAVGLHLHTSRPEGDAGNWTLTVDEDILPFDAAADGSPYHARVGGDVTPSLDALKNGAVAYLEPSTGAPLALNAIPLTGSLYAINQALYFCAPKAVPQ